MKINAMQFSINSKCEIVSSPEVKKALVSDGFATKVIAHFEGGLNRIYHTLNSSGIKEATTYKGHLEDIPDTPLWEKARELVRKIQQV